MDHPTNDAIIIYQCIRQDTCEGTPPLLLLLLLTFPVSHKEHACTA